MKLAEVKKRKPSEILGSGRLHDLWGEGYTVVPRLATFDVPEHIIPHGMTYQWNEIRKSEPKVKYPEGWTPVSAERHPGLFAPFGYVGNIEVGGMVLCEKPRTQVEAAHAERIAGA